MDVPPSPTQIDNESRLRHVLLATDLGASSARAADEAIDLAAQQGAVLLILTVVPPAGLPHLGRHRRPDDERDRRAGSAQALVARATARGVTATSVVWFGDPAESILEAAWTERADVVVLGARRRTNLGRLLGSVSAHVADEASCRVMIVPA